MTEFFLLLIAVLTLQWLYVLILTIASAGRKRDTGVVTGEQATILIPWRHEKHLPELVQALSKLKNSTCIDQILFLNDHNETSERNGLYELIKGNPSWKIIDLPENAVGKKIALEAGVAQANTDVILVMDADCIPDRDWISDMLGGFNDESTAIVSGSVQIKPSSGLILTLQELEQFAFETLTRGTTMLGSPALLSAASMGFRKSWFKRVNGYNGCREVSSGDDMFLLYKICKAGGRVSTAGGKGALVVTEPVHGMKRYFAQRFRWFSKMLIFPDKKPFLALILDLLIRLSVISLPLFEMLEFQLSLISFIPLFLKYFIDFLLVFLPALRRKRLAVLIGIVPGLFTSACLQVSILLAMLTGKKQEWKGRAVCTGLHEQKA